MVQKHAVPCFPDLYNYIGKHDTPACQSGCLTAVGMMRHEFAMYSIKARATVKQSSHIHHVAMKYLHDSFTETDSNKTLPMMEIYRLEYKSFSTFRLQ